MTENKKMMHSKIRQLYFFLLYLPIILSLPLFAQDQEETNSELFEKGIKVDLRNPTLNDGILRTEEGGVITGPNIRIQALKITYMRKFIDGEAIFKIEAEDDVMLEMGEYVFVGKKLDYDFQSKTGVFYEVRSVFEPWYVGGEKIEILGDGNYIIHQGFITTSENYNPDWQISSKYAILSDRKLLNARKVKFQFFHVPLFWLPSFKINLNAIFDHPIRYNIRWNGRRKTRFGLEYEIFSWRKFKTFLRMDYRLNRGPGIGIETTYNPPEGKENFESISYIARDSSTDNPHERTRYRYQGLYNNYWEEKRISIALSYDKLSDKDMATDYNDRGLELDTAGRTQLHLRRQEEWWIANFVARARVNNFQTLKQELPTLEGNFKPRELGHSKIISEHSFKVSYLDFQYANFAEHVHDYHSSRLEYRHQIYRCFKLGILNITPAIGGEGIYYGNSPQNDGKLLGFGTFKLDAHTQFFRFYDGNFKHIIRPYAQYTYLTFPSVSPHDHFIFDINDGWYRLNQLRFGIQNNFFFKNENGCIARYLTTDLYAFAFFDTPTLPYTIPRIYADMTWNFFSTLRHTLGLAWDLRNNQLYHINFRTEWTISENFAIYSEYRHRSSFDYRKVQKENFILNSFRPQEELLHSQLSDRRDTLLFHLFYRWHPNWALEFESRHGWNRKHEPSYNEYEVDLLTTLPSALQIKIAYQRKENERAHRLAVYFSVGLKRPEPSKSRNLVPSIDF